MKKSVKVLGITAAMMAALTMGGCGTKPTETVATVYGENVSVSELGMYTIYQQVQYEQFYSMYLGTSVDWSQEYDGSTMEDETKANALDTFKKMKIVAAHAGDYNVSVSEKEQKKIDKAAKKLVKSNDTKAQKVLYITEDGAKELFKTYYLYNKTSEAMVADVDTNVSDEEAAQKKMSYVKFDLESTTDEEGNTVELTEDEKKEAKAKAEEVAKAGADKLEASVEGTDYTVETATFDDESDTLDKKVYKAAKKLKEGQMSKVIETDSACYVIRLDSNLDREATDSKKEEIVSQRKSDAFDAIYEEWEKADDAFVVDEKVWKTIRFKDKITLKQEETETSEENTETKDTADTEETQSEETTEATE